MHACTSHLNTYCLFSSGRASGIQEPETGDDAGDDANGADGTGDVNQLAALVVFGGRFLHFLYLFLGGFAQGGFGGHDSSPLVKG